MDPSGSPNDITKFLGRQLPYSYENEQALLGALILESQKIGEITRIVASSDFYIEQHRKIYETLIALSASGKAIDVITLLNALVRNGVYKDEASGEAYIRQLAENVPSVLNIEDYANVVHEKAVLRELIEISEKTADSSYTQTVESAKIIDEAEDRLYKLSGGTVKRDLTPISEILQQFYSELKTLTEEKENTTILKTYYPDLDTILVGMNPGDFIVIGGRPGMGKTSFAMNIATEVAKHRKDKAIAVFSLEMSKTQLASRMLSSEAKVESVKLREGSLGADDYERLAESATALSETKIYIDDTSDITTVNMMTKLRQIKDLGLVIIDYLQLMHSSQKFESRVLEIGDITRSLKIMAKELNCPVIACSQLSRISKDRTDKRPQLTDLRDSGTVEQDADIVLFIHRDYYYSKKDEVKNLAECIIAKNRHGASEDVKLGWNGQFTRFTSLEKKYDQAER